MSCNGKECFLTSPLVFLPLGGLGEIGCNLALYGIGKADNRRWIMVDCGIGFADDTLPGVEIVMPDIRWARQEAARLDAIFITHAHEDHYGALPFLATHFNVPVHMTSFAALMLRAKLAEYRQDNPPDIHTITPGTPVRAGPFEVEFVPLSHSIPQSCALCIKAGGHTIVHSGDWKIDDTGVDTRDAFSPGGRLAQIGAAGVDALICDSTNILRDGTSASEADVAASLCDIVASATGRVALTTFSSNVTRIESAARAALKAGRKTVLLGRSLRRVVSVARDCGCLKDIPQFGGEDEFRCLAPGKVLAILTGSQGEPRAALQRMAQGSFRGLQFASGDMVIYSSRAIPGNEMAINQTQNLLALQDVRIMTDSDALVHVSGHPRRGEVARLYRILKPACVIPAHGEHRHLRAHCEFASSNGVPHVVRARNGDIVALAPGPAAIVDEAPSGLVVKDGALLARAEDSGIPARRALAQAGIVMIGLVLDRAGRFADEPQITTLGLPRHTDEGARFDDIILDIVEEMADGRQGKAGRNLATRIEKAVISRIFKIWGKKPKCVLMTHMID